MFNKMRYSFFPSQPEIMSNCSFYKEYKPMKSANNDIALYCEFQLKDKASSILPIIPDGSIEILFSCDEKEPIAFVATSPEKRCDYQFQSNIRYFGIRLSPGQNKILFNCSMKELLNYKQIPLLDVLKEDESFIEGMLIKKNFKERINWVQSYINKSDTDHSYAKNLLTYCLNRIYSTNGTININELSSETGYTDRYIRKKFESFVGYSPKKFSQIVRLQHSINKLVSQNIKVSNVIDEHAFYDESHFYKDFKKYISLTPNEYLDQLINQG
ncbi:helix-turn-helix transcriptional regulator [Metabacillus sediminilitoris]|uniref:Helix-turn-helix domain-containing protein n=1 Tax=Metabacillus sediminilitoris TaxID=2567941 RepID=A0A4S4BUQ2_9BACI|nr:helix-turn-helix transcriptional regulator [Metabacillus sediminilitoris]QGQ44804.1 helix-turn-helix domain-containing protein [Metabacillus sediminilitoris]THF78848.1 helix-turn-helix domain-containing protein [Metabacillus sediminilitoris]